ncbi:MAG: sortase [Anaerolineae bacterium]|nr:MAG: sortase [Anaerolineae bacterium]
MTTTKKNLTLILITVLLITSLSAVFTTRAASLPVTGAQAAPIAASAAASPAKGSLTATKVVAHGLFTYTVVQNGNSVPTGGSSVGQYAAAAKKKSIGLLAHNYLAGGSFASLKVGQLITVTFSDGSTKTYKVYSVQTYQATDPNDFSQPFINSNGKKVSARTVFNAAYKANQVTFQTCIAKNGYSSWGVLFVIAKEVP